jgi:putative Mn2+ efflux pump MntP
MDILIIVLIGIGLAMDCFAVALARGAQPGMDKTRLALVFAFVFGVFQAGMTVIGWAGGSLFMGIIAPWDHWIAFIILVAIGLKMIIEGFRGEPEDAEEATTFPQITTILLLAVATSLDALAVGLGFALLNIDILLPGIIIGLIAAGFAIAGVFLGTSLEKILGNKIEILGGIILVGIGFKILLEHVI